MIQIILFYSLLIILSAVIINGFYSITRGRWEVKPDGTREWVGKIFKGYHYWLQRHDVKTVAYSGEEFLKALAPLKSFFDEKNIIAFDVNFIVVKRMEDVKLALFYLFAASKGIMVDVKPIPDGGWKGNHIIGIYKEVHEYKMPEWVRDPLGMCINCLASVAGTLLWIFWIGLAHHVNSFYPTEAITGFLAIGWGFKIGLWALFCFTLAHLNEYILNLNNSAKK